MAELFGAHIFRLPILVADAKDRMIDVQGQAGFWLGAMFFILLATVSIGFGTRWLVNRYPVAGFAKWRTGLIQKIAKIRKSRRKSGARRSMFIGTQHLKVLGRDEDGALVQIDIEGDLSRAIRVESLGSVPEALAFAYPELIVSESGPRTFFLQSIPHYLCAIPDCSIATNSPSPGSWETFSLVTDSEIESHKKNYKSNDAEGARLHRRVAQLRDANLPVKFHIAAGEHPLPGFINIDYVMLSPRHALIDQDNYFILNYVGSRIPIPDESVDYIFHEDFLEHIDQLGQIQFLAEMLRILKKGGVHRINTPNLIPAMRNNSDFSRGSDGVYTGELEWGHVALLTRSSLEEMSRLVGYSDIVFTGRSRGTSPHAIADRRPFADRDDIDGNLFADLFR